MVQRSRRRRRSTRRNTRRKQRSTRRKQRSTRRKQRSTRRKQRSTRRRRNTRVKKRGEMEGAAAAAPPSPDWDYLAAAAPSLNWDHVKKIWALESKEESEYIKEHGQSLYNTRRIFNAYLKLPLQMNDTEVKTMKKLIDADIMEGGDPGKAAFKRLDAMRLDSRINVIMEGLGLQTSAPLGDKVATLFDADPGGPSLYASHESQKERHELFKDITDATVSRQEVARAPTPPA